MLKNKKIPMRMCSGCREMKPKQELIRIVRTPDGDVLVDTKGKVSGRGTYVCKNIDCLEKSIKTKSLSRSLDVTLSEEIISQLRENING